MPFSGIGVGLCLNYEFEPAASLPLILCVDRDQPHKSERDIKCVHLEQVATVDLLATEALIDIRFSSKDFFDGVLRFL